MDAETLARALALLLGGGLGPADPLILNRVAPRRVGPVVWRDQGDEVLLHLDRLRVRFVEESTLSIGLELETDQTGPQPVQVVFHLGGRQGAKSLLVATEEFPRGDERLIGRWGRPLQGALFAALVRLAELAAAREPNQVPALAIQRERLILSVQGENP